MWDILDKKPLKIDWACGCEIPPSDFVGIDVYKFPHITIEADLTQPFQLPDNCVDESRCSNFLEHLYPAQLVDFLNELHRVHKKNTKAWFRVPLFNAEHPVSWLAAMSDPTHVNYFTTETLTYFNINHFRWHFYAKYYRGNRTLGIPPFKLIGADSSSIRFLDFTLLVVKDDHDNQGR